MSSCTCDTQVNPAGTGACRVRDENFDGAFSCFVSQPSNCTDLKNSPTNPGKQISAAACEDENEGKIALLVTKNIDLFVLYWIIIS